MSSSEKPLRRTALLTALSALAGLALTAASATAAPDDGPQASTGQAPSLRELPEPPDAVKARELLADLVVADEDDVPGYSRSNFPHRITQSGTCDTREVVLQRDGQDVVQDDQCRATSGTWYSEYDGRTIESASGIDIDHVVPLKEAWRSGASEWSTPERRAFANDLTDSQPIAVSAASNRSKGDKDPGNWKPPLQSYHCTYSRAWISVKATYQLTANPPRLLPWPRCSTPAPPDPTGPHTGRPGRPCRGDRRMRTAHHRCVQGRQPPPGRSDRGMQGRHPQLLEDLPRHVQRPRRRPLLVQVGSPADGTAGPYPPRAAASKQTAPAFRPLGMVGGSCARICTRPRGAVRKDPPR